MRSSRALGHAFAAAVACVADDPPPLAGEDRGLVPRTYVAGQLRRPAEIDHLWLAITETPRTRQLEASAPAVRNARAAWRGTTDRSRETLQPPQIALRAATLDRVRAVAMSMTRDHDPVSAGVYDHSPRAARAPPAPLTDPRRGDQP